MAWAVTGTGIVTSVGSHRKAYFSALCSGISGNKPLQSFDSNRYKAKHAYEIADRLLTARDTKARCTRWLCAAVNEAVQSSGLMPGQERIAIMVGTGLRELRSLELWRTDGQPFTVDELHFSGALRAATGCHGSILTIANACASSNFALGLAEDMLALGEADAIIVAGCDSITESMFGLLDRANPLCPERVQTFARDRQGVLMGEGAAALVLESAEHAAARGTPPMAWLRGVGMSCDAYHETAPSREGVLQAMRDAHRRAGTAPDQIDLLLVHGTGTILNDQTEALALRDLFGIAAERVIITGIKTMTGHTSGASGLVGVVTAIECMQQGRIPPTVGFTVPMPEAEGFNIVIGTARTATVQRVQVNAFGFGGVNAVAIVERFDP